jgi:hypothetical protein
MPKVAGKKATGARARRHASGDQLVSGKLVRGMPDAPWWLDADAEGEVCAVCSNGFAYGMGYRCSGCDAAVCGFCVESRGAEFWCVEC